MDHFQTINPQDAYQRMQSNPPAVLFDIRDPASFNTAHACDAQHLTNDSMLSLLEKVEFDQPILVICYHGISSQGAAQYLVNQGYDEVYSVDGGFEAWLREGLPVQASN